MSIEKRVISEISLPVDLKKITLFDIEDYFKHNTEGFLGIVYCYTSISSNKKYVGQTRQPRSRHYTHLSSSHISSKRSDANSLFSNAIREEGFDNFKYNVLKVCHAHNRIELQKQLNNYERYYITFYQTTDRTKGYNLECGGIGEPLGGTSHLSKAIKQYTLCGEFVREYECINDAARETLICASSISMACSISSKRKVAGGYLWANSENSLDPSYIEYATRYSGVHRYTIEGKYIDSYPNYKTAALQVNGDRARIHLCAKPPYINVAYGFRWSNKRITRLKSSPAKLCIEVHKYDKTGLYVASYESLAMGARSINYKFSSHLSQCLIDSWRKAGGYYWRTFRTDRIEIPTKKRISNGK